MGLNHSIQPRIRPLCCCLILAVNAMTGSAAWAEAGADEGADTELSQLPSPAPERDETLRNQAVEAQLALTDKATESLWLGQGKARFLGLKRQDTSGETFANALILHDNQQNPDWPGVVRTLRKELAAVGWNTLSIAVPDYRPVKAIPPLPEQRSAITTELDTEATEPEATLEQDTRAASGAAAPPSASEAPPGEQLEQRIRLATQTLNTNSPLPLVIIAVGSSATLVAKQAQELLLEDINGLVILDPVPLPGLEGYDETLDAMDLRIPVLDLAPEFNPRSNPKARADNARKLQQDAYQQRIIRGSNQDFRNAETQVLKAVRGWGEVRFKR